MFKHDAFRKSDKKHESVFGGLHPETKGFNTDTKILQMYMQWFLYMAWTEACAKGTGAAASVACW
jgi:hypothetical protein